MSAVDWTFQTDDDYADRPGVSPIVASLRAAGVIRDAHRVLEVGCGTGMDAVGLARSGVRRVVGLEARAEALVYARRRAAAASVDVGFVRGSAYALRKLFPRGSFDIVVDTLLGNNLRQQHKYADAIAHVLKQRGKLIATYKVDAPTESLPEFETGGAFSRDFRVGRQLRTELPSRTWKRKPTFVHVITVVATRK